MDCIFCRILNKEIIYPGLIKEYAHWVTMVSREQHTAGTIIIMLKRHIVRFSAISGNELSELQQVQLSLENSLDNLFKPQLYNYLQCGNSVEHLHIHLIPRYKQPVLFANRVYTDHNFGDSIKESIEIESQEIIEELSKAISKLL